MFSVSRGRSTVQCVRYSNMLASRRIFIARHRLENGGPVAKQRSTPLRYGVDT
ncbi:hypothetical protein MICRO80W_10009 [Micrococcus luteus]|nr:hypothetical protein MICRO80W_10009 [Micrococcus luteus]